MIKQIKHYLTKHNDANLWIAHRAAFEEKKLAVESAAADQTVTQLYEQEAVSQQQVVFSNYDVGQTREETNRIQQLYSELEDIVRLPKLAI